MNGTLRGGPQPCGYPYSLVKYVACAHLILFIDSIGNAYRKSLAQPARMFLNHPRRDGRNHWKP